MGLVYAHWGFAGSTPTAEEIARKLEELTGVKVVLGPAETEVGFAANLGDPLAAETFVVRTLSLPAIGDSFLLGRIDGAIRAELFLPLHPYVVPHLEDAIEAFGPDTGASGRDWFWRDELERLAGPWPSLPVLVRLWYRSFLWPLFWRPRPAVDAVAAGAARTLELEGLPAEAARLRAVLSPSGSRTDQLTGLRREARSILRTSRRALSPTARMNLRDVARSARDLLRRDMDPDSRGDDRPGP